MFIASGNIPVCPLAMPVPTLKFSVASYMSIGPPSALVSFNLLVPGLAFVPEKPVKLLPPAKWLPLVSAFAFVKVIALPFSSVNVKTVAVAVTVRFGIAAVSKSVFISSGVDTFEYCDPFVVKFTRVLPLPLSIYTLNGVYPPTNP